MSRTPDPLRSLRDTVRRYGITVDDYHERLRAQHYGCAICGNTCFSGRRLAIDHDHETGVVRGLLCNACNIGLGKFRDNPELLTRAAEYLSSTT